MKCYGLNKKNLKSPEFCFDLKEATPSRGGRLSLHVPNIPEAQLCIQATIKTHSVGPPSIYNINRLLVLVANKTH